MSEKDDGGPAFPMPMTMMTSNHIANEPEYGMTLRDYFAAHVMNAMLSNFEWMKHCANESGLPGELSIPIMSYEIADAMLKERAK